MKTKKPSSSVNLDKLSHLEKQNSELREKLARSLADYVNLEKRIENQRQFFVTLTTISIITKMIEVLDDLRLTQDHLQDQGLQMTIDKFFNVLKNEGLEEIKAKDQSFDPTFMDCINTQDGEDNKILSVHKKGYLLNGQVIRPAQVIVGKTIINN